MTTDTVATPAELLGAEAHDFLLGLLDTPAPAGFETSLSGAARTNLMHWYADDLAFVELCRELAPEINPVTA